MSKPTALELALVAAVLDPALAKAEPVRAVRIASKLISTAQKHIDLPGTAERHMQSIIAEAHAAADKIPVAERMTLSDAFNRFGKKHYKTPNGFAAALQNEGLTVFPRDGEEVTSKRLVDELLRRRAERRKRADRVRKKPVKRKKR